MCDHWTLAGTPSPKKVLGFVIYLGIDLAIVEENNVFSKGTSIKVI